MNPLQVDLKIRQATLADVEALVSFNRALAWETESRQLDERTLRAGVSALLDNPQRGFYLVTEVMVPPMTVIGQLMVTHEWSDWRNGMFWWIQSVYVHPDWRRQYVFRQLYVHVINLAKAKSNVVGIRLYVEQTNTIAQKVYVHLGLTQSPYRMFEEEFVLPVSQEDGSDG